MIVRSETCGAGMTRLPVENAVNPLDEVRQLLLLTTTNARMIATHLANKSYTSAISLTFIISDNCNNALKLLDESRK
jgi:hypothetical protein